MPKTILINLADGDITSVHTDFDDDDLRVVVIQWNQVARAISDGDTSVLDIDHDRFSTTLYPFHYRNDTRRKNACH